MFERLHASIIKEFQLLIKDKTGLTILFIMPVVLIFIMTMIQHEAYKSINETGIPVLLINDDQERLGNAVKSSFEQTPIIQVVEKTSADFSDKDQIRQSVLDGNYMVAVIVPKDATKILKHDIENIMGQFFDETELKPGDLKEIKVDLIVDPIARESFVMAISSGLKEAIANIKTQVMFQLMAENMKEALGTEQDMKIPEKDFFQFNEEYAISEGKGLVPNAVQHNVPAWAIFSIFFIVVPLAASIINERSEGLFIRLNTLPGSYLSILSGKLLIYIIMALIQFAIVIFIGKYLLPLLGLPILNLGPHKLPLVILCIAVSMTAIGYGLLLGTFFDTPAQSSIFGGISILILSALGGIWVPVSVMPPIMQSIAEFSPLNWALNGFYELFIKGGSWVNIQNNVLKLSLFFVVSLFGSFFIYKTKINFS